MHGPGNHNLPFALDVSSIDRACNSLGGDAPRAGRAHLLGLLPSNCILAERRAHVAGANGHHVNAAALQFHARCLAHGIHGKFCGAVKRVERDRNMPRDARYIHDGPRSLLLHYGNDRLHCRQSAEEVGVEHVTASGHIDLRHGIEQAVTGIVHPNINPIKVMKRQTDHAINFFAMAHVARQRQSSFGVANPVPGRFDASRVTREKHDARAPIGKQFCDGFADSHRRAGHHHDLSGKISFCRTHAELLCSPGEQVKQGVQSGKLGEAEVSALLPLFPLDVVLFPGTVLPLHIFEPRYREMISECLAEQKSFGVVRSKEEGIAEIGCTAKIVNVAKKYPDGRMDIVSQGHQRFEIMQVNRERAFLQAEVLQLQDEPSQAPPEQIAEALRLHGEILKLAGADPVNASEIEAALLSFHLTGSLPLDLDFKQTLLGMKSEAERVEAVISYFQTILPNLRRTVRVRQKAGGNGHAH